MQSAHDRQKSYADLKRKAMEFQVKDKVMLKVLPWKGVVHFGKRGKLNPSDYDCEIYYHPGKANVVADALSRKEREPLRVQALVMTIGLDLPKQILN
nr:reverse transcriptase domain-containing protein [Tanacetum cinerariifolium]